MAVLFGGGGALMLVAVLAEVWRRSERVALCLVSNVFRTSPVKLRHFSLVFTSTRVPVERHRSRSPETLRTRNPESSKPRHPPTKAQPLGAPHHPRASAGEVSVG